MNGTQGSAALGRAFPGERRVCARVCDAKVFQFVAEEKISS